MQKYITHMFYLIISILFYYFFVRYFVIEYFPFLISMIIVLYVISFLKKKLSCYKWFGFLLLFILYLLISLFVIIIVFYGLETIYHFILNSKVSYNLYLLPQLESFINIFQSYGIDQLFLSGNELMNSLFTKVIDYCLSFLSLIPSLFTTYFMVIISSFVFYISYDELKTYLLTYIPQYRITQLIQLKNMILYTLQSLFITQIQLFIIIFICLFIGFSILRLDYAFILAVFISFLDALPFIGIGIGIIPMVLYYLFCKSYFKALYLFVLYLFIHVLRTILENHLMKNKLHVPTFFIFISFFLHLELFGFIGIVISPLTLCVIHSLLDNYKRIK